MVNRGVYDYGATIEELDDVLESNIHTPNLAARRGDEPHELLALNRRHDLRQRAVAVEKQDDNPASPHPDSLHSVWEHL
jgi:hypothetical protein